MSLVDPVDVLDWGVVELVRPRRERLVLLDLPDIDEPLMPVPIVVPLCVPMLPMVELVPPAPTPVLIPLDDVPVLVPRLVEVPGTPVPVVLEAPGVVPVVAAPVPAPAPTAAPPAPAVCASSGVEIRAANIRYVRMISLQ